jgi:hypothetical protein
VNVSTSSESPHTPITDPTTRRILPPLPPSPFCTIVVSNPSTLGNGSIPLSTSTTTLFTQSAMGPPFSYGIPIFDSNSSLTYSTLQTMGLGAGISNAPMQGSTGGAYIPFNAIPYGGGYIPPLSPLISGSFQKPIEPNATYILFGGGGLGPPSYTTSMGSMSFYFFDAFGKNAFYSVIVLVGGNPKFGKQNPVQGTIPSQGVMTGVFSTQGLWNTW